MPLQRLMTDGYEITALYYNPNIHPKEEYLLRSNTFVEYANDTGISVISLDTDWELWESEVAINGGVYPLVEGGLLYNQNMQARLERCRGCYRLRFKKLAQTAIKMGIDTIATTLTISPYQFTDVINSELLDAASRYGLRAVVDDLRELYPEATRRSRELGMYRQNYCGCRYSELEAGIERQARKNRKAQKNNKAILDTAHTYPSENGLTNPASSAHELGESKDPRYAADSNCAVDPNCAADSRDRQERQKLDCRFSV
jgi:predicted adenine nucleotide alpha hydrolase (AANH) superfamily ATPase